MKYNMNNKPLACMLTQSTCYKGTGPMAVKGVLWHSTGANNPSLSRYVQPSDHAADREKMLGILGVNRYHNDMNHIVRQMGVNAWIGKLANGEIAAVQTMPWEYKPWGCGSGSQGSCNSGWIQFEICEDGLDDREYAMAVYQEACELTAYLCGLYGIDPHGTVRFSGVTVPTIIDHRGSHQFGLGGNHGDVAHWFPKFGKTMDSVREDVAALLAGEAVTVEQSAGESSQPVSETGLGRRLLRKGMTGDDVADLQRHLIALGYDLGSSGADGDFGSRTDSAVRAFQQGAGLTVDGLYGEKTHAALMEAVSGRNEPKLLVTSDTSVLAGNGGQYAVIAAVRAGSSFEHVATAHNGWQAVKIGSQVGWVSGEFSEITTE